MSDHIAVGIIATNEAVLFAFDRIDDLIGNFRRFHPGTLVERHDIGRYFFPRFKRFAEFFAAVAVPEIRDVTVLLRFGHGVFVDALVHEIFGQSILNFGRLDKETFGKMHIAVVL